MITIDSRVGSADLIKHFPSGMARLGRLEFGDVAFLGNGKDGEPVCIGFERKRIGDLVHSIDSGRLAGHQLIGMKHSYRFIYVIIEGIWRGNPRNGYIEEKRGKEWCTVSPNKQRIYVDSYVFNFINTIWVAYPNVNVWQTSNDRATARYIMSIYSWWTDKKFEEHRAHLANYEPYIDLTPPSPVLRVAKALVRGIGDKKAEAINEKFQNVASLIRATEEELREVYGIGSKLAGQMIKEIYSTEK